MHRGHPQALLVHRDHLGEGALKLIYDDPPVARLTTSLVIGILGHGQETSSEFDDEAFAALVSRCPNLCALYLRSWHFDSVQPHLLSQCSFSRLTSFFIGWNATLTVPGFFALLSMMPALKTLGIGAVDPEGTSDSDDAVVTDNDLAPPACSLTHLIVSDDWDINFPHYVHLLSRSHDTLEHLELHWIYGEQVADGLVAALERCTRLCHLTLIGNDFPNKRIIAASATVSSLTLVAPPTDAEFAALRAPLRALEFANCYVHDPEDFIDAAWEQLRGRVPQAPALESIKFSLMRDPVVRETDGYREMRRVCKERRIHLSLRRDFYGLNF
ncbi:hypothetical protein AURDEDRAFT_169219 [Auricularia subglabra TFB-10046 SS5]|nr:hypothetical protein AURDEDRAFT_169219 [Auricularia subglabra TFB-10046 SS5]